MKRIYSLWCYCWFLAIFLVLFPFFFLFLQKERWKPRAHYLNRLWARIFFPLVGLPVRVEYRWLPDRSRPFVFCANHTSYLDIAVMGLVVPNYYAFIGKRSLQKIPLFGYMFTKLHIAVERSSRLSSHQTYRKSLEALDAGRSIVVFPEGGILTKQPPAMTPFKEGPFRMAIEKKAPIVPIVFPYNWLILPDDGRLLFSRHVVKAIVLEPIETAHLTLADVEPLKAQTYRRMQEELQKYFPA